MIVPHPSRRTFRFNAAQVCNAALLEVGLLFQVGGNEDEGVYIIAVPDEYRLLGSRALAIARMYAEGPRTMSRCVLCSWSPDNPPCTPAIDVLRGLTCAPMR